MPGRLIYSILAIGTAAMLLFVAGFVCFELGLSYLTAGVYFLAEKMLLLAFALLMLLGGLALIRALQHELQAYFCQEAAALRRLLAIHLRTNALTRRNALQARQIRYFSRLKHQRLLAADNRKQLRALHRAIQQELMTVKNRMPANNYQALCKDLRQHHKQADAQAMLALRQQIPCP